MSGKYGLDSRELSAVDDHLEDGVPRFRVEDDANRTVDVPSDYATVAEAIDALEGEVVPSGVRLTINIETGHQLQEGYSFEYGIYRHLRITSDDNVVDVSTDFSPASPGPDAIWGAKSATTPLIEVLVDGSNSPVNPMNGLYLQNGGHLAFSGSGGVQNCEYGAECYLGSTLIAQGATIRNNANWGIAAWNTSVIGAGGADLSGNGTNVFVAHDSRAHLQSANLSGANNEGLFIDVRGTADAFNATINNSGGNGVEAYTGGIGGLQGATVSGSSNNDLSVNNGAILAANGTTTSSSGGSQPATADCNVRPNTLDPAGMIFSGGHSANFVWQTGSTANRPGSPSAGQRYFDTDLGQPIWYDGAGWVDATGSAV